MAVGEPDQPTLDVAWWKGEVDGLVIELAELRKILRRQQAFIGELSEKLRLCDCGGLP
jgi:hypothetical protein